MSLDVYLAGEVRTVKCICSHCWDEHEREETDYLYEANITHNLARMADAAGIYEHLWHPERVPATKAVILIDGLTAGLERLEEDPDHFRELNPENGWGNYEGLVRFVRNYLRACKLDPDARIEVSR